eukprot:354622-Chlamydomonas_euryale.AAC.19
MVATTAAGGAAAGGRAGPAGTPSTLVGAPSLAKAMTVPLIGWHTAMATCMARPPRRAQARASPAGRPRTCRWTAPLATRFDPRAPPRRKPP